MPLKKLHWQTARNSQKIGYLASKLSLLPDAQTMSMGKRMEYHYSVSEEQIATMPIKEAVYLLRALTRQARERLLASFDQDLEVLAEVETLENNK